MPPSLMTGIRNFKFTEGSNILTLIDTDFWIDYDAEVQGTGEAELRLTLNAIWQHSDFTLAQGRPRRTFMEDRLKELKWDFVGKKGTLIIDEGTAQEKTLVDITLLSVGTNEGSINDLLDYSIEFGFPLTSQTGVGGLEVARNIEFLKFPHGLGIRSEEFDDAAWVKGLTATVTANQGTAPDGTFTADDLEDLSGANIGVISQFVTIPLDLQQYEYTIFLKKTTSAASFPGVGFTLTGGSPNIGPMEFTVNTDNGSLQLRSGSATGDIQIVVSARKSFWRIVLRLTNNNLNSTALLQIFPAVNTDGLGSWIATTTGKILGWGGQVSRTLAIKGAPVPYQSTVATPTAPISFAAENYIIDRNREDRAQFKNVFRAQPVRVRGGTGVENLRVTGIKQLLTGATDLLKRQDAESLIKTWTDIVGLDGLLKIDPAGVPSDPIILAHLRDALSSDLSLPDAVTYDLEFTTDYTD